MNYLNYIKKFQLPNGPLQQDNTQVELPLYSLSVKMTPLQLVKYYTLNQPNQTIREMTPEEIRKMELANYRESGLLTKDILNWTPIVGDGITYGLAILDISEGRPGTALTFAAFSAVPFAFEKVPFVRKGLLWIGKKIDDVYDVVKKGNREVVKKTINTSIEDVIDLARRGDKESIEQLTMYGIPYKNQGVYRHVSRDEVAALLRDRRIVDPRGTGKVDITSSLVPTTGTTGDYRITFKMDFDKPKSSSNRAIMKNQDLGDGWISDGLYSLDEVAKIERRNPDGSYSVVYKQGGTLNYLNYVQ